MARYCLLPKRVSPLAAIKTTPLVRRSHSFTTARPFTVDHRQQINISLISLFLLLCFWRFIVICTRIVAYLSNGAAQAANNTVCSVLDAVFFLQCSDLILNINDHRSVAINTAHNYRVINNQREITVIRTYDIFCVGADYIFCRFRQRCAPSRVSIAAVLRYTHPG
nr:MAG TPA: hypothetical protein [Caudoviricetes sp.]